MATKKKTAPTAAERVAKHRAQMEADGGRQVAVMLDAKSVAKLERLRARGESITEVINRLLHEAR